jgi:hypothetical protein
MWKKRANEPHMYACVSLHDDRRGTVAVVLMVNTVVCVCVCVSYLGGEALTVCEQVSDERLQGLADHLPR